MNRRTRAPKHDWQPITLVQSPPRMKCMRCGAVRRWSSVEERYHYYMPGGYFVPGRLSCVAVES